MKKDLIFKGVATALITPFKNEKIDYVSLKRIIDYQLAAGIDALVIAGTTGEGATLCKKERYKLFEFCSDYVGSRVPLIFGVGTNNTKESIEHSKRAEAIGANALLVITPYYNKGTDEGILSHYFSIANSTDLPIIVYNVPSRTGVNLSIELLKKLAECEKIVGLKEASDSIDRLMALSCLTEKMTLYSGNDSQIYLNLAVGGMGVISVASNLIPRQMKEITESYFSASYQKSLKAQQELMPFINLLFKETNPSPIKYAMSLRGLCLPDMRLPLTPPSEETAKLIEKELHNLNTTVN